MSNSKQLKLGVVLSYGQMICGVLITLFYTPIMISKLGKSEYGLYSVVYSAISMMSILSLGFNAGYIRYYSKYKRNENELAIYKLNAMFITIFAVIGLVALLCGFTLANHLSLVFDKGLTTKELERAKLLMILLTINLAESFPASVFQNIISAHERFVVLKLFGIIKTVLSPLISIPLLLLGYKSIALVMVTFLVNIFVDSIYVYYTIYVLKQKFYWGRIDVSLFKDLLVYTSFIAINIVVDQVNWNIDKLILGRYRGTEEVALYATGFLLYQFYQTISSSISSIFNPRIFRICELYKDDIEKKQIELSSLFIKVGRIQFIVTSFVCIGMILLGKEFIILWVGDKYEISYYVALLLMVPATIPLIQNLGIDIQRALNKHRFRSLVYIVMAIINFVMSVYLGKKYGAIGTSIGTAISLVIANGIIINIYYCLACGIDIPRFWKNILSMSLGCISPIIIVVIINHFCFMVDNWWSFIIKCIIYGICFLISVWLISMNSYEKELLLGSINRFLKRE